MFIVKYLLLRITNPTVNLNVTMNGMDFVTVMGLSLQIEDGEDEHRRRRLKRRNFQGKIEV